MASMMSRNFARALSRMGASGTGPFVRGGTFDCWRDDDAIMTLEIVSNEPRIEITGTFRRLD